jgi:hypothetical protein
VQATEAAGDREHAAGERALIEIMAPNGPGRRTSPGKLQHSLTIMPAALQRRVAPTAVLGSVRIRNARTALCVRRSTGDGDEARPANEFCPRS